MKKKKSTGKKRTIMRRQKKKSPGAVMVKRGAGLTKKDVLETQNFDLLFPYADEMEARLGRQPDWFDWVSFAGISWAEGTLKASTGEPKPDDPADFARRLIDCVVKTRQAIEKGQADRAAYYAVEFGKLMEAVFIKKYFKDGTAWGRKEFRSTKDDALDNFLLKCTQDYIKKNDKIPQLRELLSHIERLNDKGPIDHIDSDNTVYWWPGEPAANPLRSLKFPALQKRFTTILKKLKKRNLRCRRTW